MAGKLGSKWQHGVAVAWVWRGMAWHGHGGRTMKLKAHILNYKHDAEIVIWKRSKALKSQSQTLSLTASSKATSPKLP